MINDSKKIAIVAMLPPCIKWNPEPFKILDLDGYSSQGKKKQNIYYTQQSERRSRGKK